MDNTNIQEEKRLKQMAILKASNELLRQSKEKALNKITDPLKKSEIKRAFEKAINENYEEGESYLQANSNDIEQSTYRDVDKAYVEKYNNRLEKKGLTDEELHRKGVATVSQKEEKSGWKLNRRKRDVEAEDKAEIVRVANEDDIMQKTMVSNDKQIVEKKSDNEKKVKKATKVDKLVENAVIEHRSQKIEREPNADSVKLDVEEQPTAKPTKNKTSKSSEQVTYDFDFSEIPAWVQYDVIPLPSNGECYPLESPLRCGRIPVAYLTAADENIIVSPNVYRDGKIIDIILERKILDKRIKVSDLVMGDRDAIVLWLRATSYGDDFPIAVTNPSNGKEYKLSIPLSQFKYLDFNLKGDDDGLFDYTTTDGNKIKFKYLNNDENEGIKRAIAEQFGNIDRIESLKILGDLSATLKRLDFSGDEREMIDEDIKELTKFAGKDVNMEVDDIYPESITKQMCLQTVSVNGNEDREYIEKFINNMRSGEALAYRTYFLSNKPGVDFNFTVEIPESDGGGSFATFLRIDDTIFINA